MNRICAYCGSDKALTREHIWPAGILKRDPDFDLNFYGKQNQVFGGHQVLKDVCAACNNGALSGLDNYICKLYDQYFVRMVKSKEYRTFTYDYDRLLRWLLKVSYNTARQNATHIEPHMKYASYIINGGLAPDTVKIFCEIILPSKNPLWVSGGKEPRLVYPDTLRSGHVVREIDYKALLTTRLVAIKSYYFYIVIGSEGTKLYKQSLGKIPARLIDSGKTSVNLRGGRDMFTLHGKMFGRIPHEE